MKENLNIKPSPSGEMFEVACPSMALSPSLKLRRTSGTNPDPVDPRYAEGFPTTPKGSVATASGEARGAPPSVRFGAIRALLVDCLELTKPRLTFLVLVTAVVGFCMGSRGPLNGMLLVHTILGTALVAGGASAFNQLLERDADARMKRTRDRPLPAGRLQLRDALVFGTILSATGVLYLASAVNLLTGFLGFIAWTSYVLIYTPLKKRTPLCTVVGAVPGAIPPMMGWTAATHSVDPGAWTLFAILFLWQIPHFLALARMYREDYASGGFPMLTVVDLDGSRTSRQIFWYCLALVPVSLIPCLLGLSGKLYFMASLALGLGFLGVGIRAALLRTMSSSRHLFFASIFYLPFLLMFMLASKVTP